VAAVAESVMVPVRPGGVRARLITEAERSAFERLLELPSAPSTPTGLEISGR
jgi:hypothetical protein